MRSFDFAQRQSLKFEQDIGRRCRLPLAQSTVAEAVEAYKGLLRAKEQELIRAIATVECAGREMSGPDPQDPLDKASGSFVKEFLFRESDYDREILSLVQDALMRAENGEFGACAACGKPMDQKRLEAVPWARHCMRCQNLQDKGLL